MRILLKIFGIISAIVIAAFIFLNFFYLPQKVKSTGPKYLQEKTKGLIKAENIRYSPFKGIELENISLVSKTEKTILSIDKAYFRISLWPLLSQRKLCFALDFYPAGIKNPVQIKGCFRKPLLNAELKIENQLFSVKQTVTATLEITPNEDNAEGLNINLFVSSSDLNLRGLFYTDNKDLHIEQCSGKIFDSTFEFIGDVEELSNPSLNIYGNLDLNLGDLTNLSPDYAKTLNQFKMNGRCNAEIYIASDLNNPEVGIKMNGSEISVERIKIDHLSVASKLKNKTASLDKCYITLYGGEVNLLASSNLNVPDPSANLDINIFNLDLHQLITDLAQKSTPLHGRLFSLGRLSAPLKDPKSVQGKLWLSAAGSNILQLPLFSGIADILHMPELRNTEFKEASANFLIANRSLSSNDFKITSNNVVIYFDGALGFSGDLNVNVRPSFSESFLASPNIGNILGIFFDSTGNFLGEIKMKGSISKPHLSYKPISVNRLFPGGIEEGIRQIFRFKDKGDNN